MKSLLYCSIISLAALLAGACSAPSGGGEGQGRSAPSGKPAGQDRRSAMKKLEKGMSAEGVRALLGEPDRITVLEAPAGPGEAWLYRSVYPSGSRHIPTGSTSYSRENPLTGQMETITEPVYSVETLYATTESTLILRDGTLVEWRHETLGSRKVN